jgi:hypothetical protein
MRSHTIPLSFAASGGAASWNPEPPAGRCVFVGNRPLPLLGLRKTAPDRYGGPVGHHEGS